MTLQEKRARGKSSAWPPILLVARALAIVGVQLLTFGVLSRHYAIGAGFLPSSGRTERLPRNKASPGEGSALALPHQQKIARNSP
jgi:hypothetical protein